MWTAERCANLLAKAKRSPQGWKACCPAHEDSEPSLFLADGENGVALVCYAGCSYQDVASQLEQKGAVLHADDRRSSRHQIPDAHYQLGAPHSSWDYRNALGEVIMRICRWEHPGGRKEIRPLIKTADGWKWAHHPTPRPLFQLDRLMNEPERPVIVVEGEKAAVAAQKLFPDYIATTWPGGAASTGQVDFDPIRGRDVVLIPDCDPAGRKAMAWVAHHLSQREHAARSVRVVDPATFDADLPQGWDLADALEEKREVSMWLLASGNPPPVRHAMRWAELQGREPPQRIWQVAHWLSSGTTLLAGRGGVGKTLLAQTLATALALGKNFLDAVSGPKIVLFWACEDDHDELWRRQVAICKYLGVDLKDLEGKLMIEPRSGLDNTLFYAEYGAPKWTPLFGELAAQVNDYQADVTFIDNIGQTFGGKENDRHHVTSFVNGLTGLGRAGRIHSTIVLAHPGKHEDSEFSGSTAWENSVRMRWYMGHKLPDQTSHEADEEEDPDVRYIAKRKTNYTVKDYRKLIYRQGVFETHLEAGSFSDRYNHGRRNEAAEEVVLKAIDKFLEISVRTTDARTSPDYLPKKMRGMKLAQDFSPKELAEALNRLRLDGRVVEGPIGKFANRTVKYGLVRGK